MPNAPDLDLRASPEGWLDLGPGWLFASIRDAVIVADAESGRIALWNPAATHLLGFEPDEVVGLPLGQLIHDLQETRQWHTARTGGSSKAPLELFASRKHGAEVCVELTLSPLNSAADRHAYVLAVVRDITERRLADEERLERVRELIAREESVAAHRRLEVLAEASRLLDASLDYEATLQEVAGVAVNTMADWCIVHLLEHDGSIRWLALAHGDPAKEAVARELQERYPSTDAVARAAHRGVRAIWRRGRER